MADLDDATTHIDLQARIDVMIALIDAPDEDGLVWCENCYDALLTTEPVPVVAPEFGLDVVLIATGIALITGLTLFLIILWSVYAVMGALLWMLVSSVS